MERASLISRSQSGILARRLQSGLRRMEKTLFGNEKIEKEMKPILCKNCRLEIARTDGDDLEIDGEIIRIGGLNPFNFGFKCPKPTIRNKKEVACGRHHVW